MQDLFEVLRVVPALAPPAVAVGHVTVTGCGSMAATTGDRRVVTATVMLAPATTTVVARRIVVPPALMAAAMRRRARASVARPTVRHAAPTAAVVLMRTA